MMNWQIFGTISASVFCGILFVVFLGREALSVLDGITVWIRARPFRAAALLPLVGLLVFYAGAKPDPDPVTPDPPDAPETPVTPVPSVGPELYADKLAKSFAGDATYIGWKRTAEGRIEGLLTIKAAKAAKPEKGGQSKLTVSYTPFSTGKKQSVKLDKSAYPVAGGNPTVDIPGIGAVTFGGLSLAGAGLQAGKDLAKSKDKAEKTDANARLARMNGTWTFAFETDAGCAGFSLTVSKGKGKLAGTLPDGTKVSVSQQGILGDTALAIPFMYAKKGSLGFVFWLHDGGAVELSDLTALKLANGTVLGASLVEPSAAHRLADGDGHVFETPFFSQTFGVAGKKWNFPKQQKKLGDADPNPYGTKLTFTEKTGVVKGSFSIPSPTGKAQKYTVNGVVVGGTFYGAAFAKGQSPVPCAAE